MTNTNFQIFIYTTIVIVVFIWSICFSVEKFDVNSFDSFKAICSGISVSLLFWFFFFRWGWKWLGLKKLIYKPNVNGTWIGEFKSDWRDKNGNELPPGKFVMVIRQSWLSYSIRAYTKLLKTQSYVETLKFDDSKGTKLFAYLYSVKRSSSGEHDTRQGAAELDLSESASTRILEGDFWTLAGTAGFVKVRQVSTTDFVESFNQACDLWKDSNMWENITEKSGNASK